MPKFESCEMSKVSLPRRSRHKVVTVFQPLPVDPGKGNYIQRNASSRFHWSRHTHKHTHTPRPFAHAKAYNQCLVRRIWLLFKSDRNVLSHNPRRRRITAICTFTLMVRWGRYTCFWLTVCRICNPWCRR